MGRGNNIEEVNIRYETERFNGLTQDTIINRFISVYKTVRVSINNTYYLNPIKSKF